MGLVFVDLLEGGELFLPLCSFLIPPSKFPLLRMQRAFLLKFLCDEVLNSSLVRQHLEQSVDSSTDLHQKVRSLCLELKNQKCKEERFVAKAAKVDRSSQEAIVRSY